MKRFAPYLILVALVLAGAAAGSKGLLIIQARPDQTTASTKLLSIRNAAGTEKVSADIEGDLVCHDLTVSGSFTLPATDFASGMTTTTITATGAAAFNAGLSVDSPAFVVANTTGALTTTGAMAANGGFSVDSPAFVVADTTGALTTTGAIAANGGFSVDSPAFVIADTTGAITTTGAAAFNGGLSVDSPAFTVANTTGDVATTGALSVTGASTLTGAVAANGGLSTTTVAATGIISGGLRQIISAASGSTQLTAAQSGALVVNTGTSSTTTFVLPSAAAGLNFCFVEDGDAAGELLVNPYAGDVIVGKIHAAQDGTALVTAAGAGIKNTAATNVRGDGACLVALDGTTWHMTSVIGLWAAQ